MVGSTTFVDETLLLPLLRLTYGRYSDRRLFPNEVVAQEVNPLGIIA